MSLAPAGLGHADPRIYLRDMQHGTGRARVIDHVADLIGEHGTDYWFANQAGRIAAAGHSVRSMWGDGIRKGTRHSGRLVRIRRELTRRCSSHANGGRRICTSKGPTSIAAGSTAPCWPV